ncbi:putative bifunctional diguanylate cyclase/phosphodiesterase [Humitalea rosea]|uniref:putative bifunctional diguanylate cyclase/phosphodiesterase n=1 Tax=Humitalea rosea TaxID=990373 RepID=UPI0011B74EF6|nr:EAL domain-containing protein [Humitalea rosea]
MPKPRDSVLQTYSARIASSADWLAQGLAVAAVGVGAWVGMEAAAVTAAGVLPCLALATMQRRALRRAEQERDLLAEATEALPGRLAIFTPDRVLIHANASYRAQHAEAIAAARGGPVRYDDLMRMTVVRTMFPDLSDPTAPAAIAAELARRIATHENTKQGSFDRVIPSGKWMRVVKRQLSGGRIMGYATDITAVKAHEALLAEAAEKARSLLESAPVGIWELDADGRTRSANARLGRLFPNGIVPSSLATAGLRRAFPDDPEGPLGFPVGREVEVGMPLASGGEGRLLVAASPWLVGGESVVLTIIDITPLKQAQAQAEHLAEHDPLTGLANRARFRAALEAIALEGAEGGALLLIDLDNFKATNDRYGHAAGDAMLIAVAARMGEGIRPGDVCCRLGGDEFAIIAPRTDEQGARAIAARLQAHLRESVCFQGIELGIAASIGIAVSPDHGRTADELQRAADLALYGVKQAGRNAALVFHPALREAVDRRETLRDALIAALNENEFHLVFQPQREVGTQRMVGAEALLRWHSSRLGRDVPPSELFPVASEARLLHAIDAWVLEEALRQLAIWRDQPGAPPVVAINASVLSLRDPGYADRVAGALLRHGVAPATLEIEIPEDLAARDIAPIEATLARLRAIGVLLALDDFGGGLSSLQHVVRLPVQRLKLDRSIVAGLDRSPGHRAVLRATVALARGMGIEVLAEGVETEAEAFAIRREGCTVIQGWLTGRPERADVLVPPLAISALRA